MDDRSRLDLALAGDPAAMHALVEAWAPVVQARVARALSRRIGTYHCDFRQEVADLTQEVFLAMFADDRRVLRGWNPALGLSLPNFVGLVAQRRVASILRARKPLSLVEDVAAESDGSGRVPHTEGAEGATHARNLLQRLLERLESTLSPRGFLLFMRLYVREESVESVSAELNINPNAVHQWKHRLGVAARAARDELIDEPESTERNAHSPRPLVSAEQAPRRAQ